MYCLLCLTQNNYYTKFAFNQSSQNCYEIFSLECLSRSRLLTFFFFCKSKGSLLVCFGEVGSILDFLPALVAHRLLKSNYNSVSYDVGLIGMVFNFVLFCFCEQSSFIGTSKIILVLFLTKMCSSLFWNRYKRILIWLHENIWKRHSLASYFYVLKRRRWHYKYRAKVSFRTNSLNKCLLHYLVTCILALT